MTHLFHPKFAGSFLFLFSLSGCAHYYFPANSLESPETLGPDRIARLEIAAIQSGTDLITPAKAQPTNAETGKTPDPVLESQRGYAFGTMLAVRPNIDVGIRIQPMAPVLVRGKYQFYGAPESQASAYNLSLCGAANGGLLIGQASGNTVTFYTGQAAFIGGFRFATRHMVSLSPFLSLAGLSGVTNAAGSGMRYGAGLGYQYDVESVIFRTELIWAAGSMSISDPSLASSSANAGGFFPGALLGFRL
ncbi:hypothetical protein WDW37_00685 [Bdellovibrionota bacterium FG-1]